MSDLENMTGIQSDRLGESLKSMLSLDYKGKRFIAPIMRSLVSEVKFRTNQLLTLSRTHKIGDTHPEIGTIGPLTYYAGRDENGYKQGGELPWNYMQGLCDQEIAPSAKRAQLQSTLAQLPSDVSFIFKAHPNLRDRNIVCEAFNRAGFVNTPRTTLLYKGTAGQDPIEFLKSHMRTKVRSARRDLEFTAMDTDSFFEYYRKNLGGKQSYFHLNIDQALLKQAVTAEAPMAEIIAVRRKNDEGAQLHPVEAAILCSTGSDGYMRFIRLSFRRAAEGNDVPPPHSNALTMVVVEAMRRAADRNLTLDVDGFTPGGNMLYSRLGGFESVVHDHFERRTPSNTVGALVSRIFT